ncbi:MAG: amidohydrolase family protein [Spirochaetaceae bacterium]|nr:amidohydrolase family protein [Spirochaetaceae bacterium]
MPEFDLVVSGARVIDPETGRDEVLSVGVRGGLIAALCKDAPAGRRHINGEGLVLSPGFIDIHTHEDGLEPPPGEAFQLPEKAAACALRTGNTTIAGGNCGYGNYPVGDYLAALARARLPITCLSFVGNISLRNTLGLDNYTQASPSQIARMKTLALAALDEGAIGISFGLQYAPGTSFAELIALAGAAAEKNTFVAVHMRHDTPKKAIETTREIIAACRISGAPVQISHFAANVYGGNNIAEASRLIIESGLDISADVYPYNAWATGLKAAVFDNGFDDFNFGVEDLEILSGPRAGERCTPESFRELRAAAHDTAVACHNAIPMADIEEAYKLPFVCVASDAHLSVDGGRVKGHPRSAGSPARFLREFVREKKLFPLIEGIKKLTLLPAQRCGLSRKGRVQEGCDADLCLFDPQTITDTADFGPETCALPPRGIKCVIAGGRVVYEGV